MYRLGGEVISSFPFLFYYFIFVFTQAYKAVVNDATIFKLELPLKQKG